MSRKFLATVTALVAIAALAFAATATGTGSAAQSRAKLAAAQRLNVQAFLGKPYTTEKLLAVLEKVLSSKI